MKTANAMLLLDQRGSNTVIEDVTPAEVQLLNAEHFRNAGKVPVHDLKENKVEVKITDAQEVRRLKRLYGDKKVNALFPGANPRLPGTFEEAMGVPTVDMPTNPLTTAGGDPAKAEAAGAAIPPKR